VFPSSDRAFEAFAHAALETLPEPATPEALQDALRVRYPAAIVTTQHELSQHGTAPLVWYAFRSALLSDDPAPARGAGTTGTSESMLVGRWPAMAILDDERRFLEVNDALAGIAEVPEALMLGRPIEAFSNPADPTIREDIAGMWTEFLVRGTMTSTLRFNYRDGRPRELEYRLEADADGPGRHRLSVRELGG
jgi:PAS domain-containing protein